MGPVNSDIALNNELDAGRLSADHNLSDRDFARVDDLPEGHPMYPVRMAAIRMALQALDLASRETGNNIDSVRRCVSATVNVVVSPNYTDVDVVAILFGNMFQAIFGLDTRPVVHGVGVAANPRGMLLSMTAEFEAAE